MYWNNWNLQAIVKQFNQKLIDSLLVLKVAPQFLETNANLHPSQKMET